LANCLTCGQPHDGTKFEECLSCQGLEHGIRVDGTGTNAQSGGGFGARPGLIIAAIGLGLTVIPFALLLLFNPSGSIDQQLGWAAVASAIMGQFVMVVGLILALIGGWAKGVRDKYAKATSQEN
jgi:hypothetical protein